METRLDRNHGNQGVTHSVTPRTSHTVDSFNDVGLKYKIKMSFESGTPVREVENADLRRALGRVFYPEDGGSRVLLHAGTDPPHCSRPHAGTVMRTSI